jgi:DNA primase small subunit
MTNRTDFSHFLPYYFSRIFPFDTYSNWIPFDRRVVGLTHPATDMFSRNVVKNFDEFKQIVQKYNPRKLDLGARGVNETYRELALDVDLPEYAEVNTCKDESCANSFICENCWQQFMVPGIRILHRALTEDLGCEKIMFSFSGKKGIHCIVWDDWCCELGNNARAYLARYLSQGVDKHSSSRKAAQILTSMNLGPQSLPRLDVPVTSQTRHLMKALFSPHPTSGLIELPIDITQENIKRPILSLLELEAELNQHNGDITKTSIFPYLRLFKQLVD